MSKIWKDYLESIDLGEHTTRKDNAFYSLSIEINKIFKYYSSEEKNKSILILNLKEALKWLAINQLVWDLPSGKASSYLDQNIDSIDPFDQIEIEILLMSEEANTVFSEWSQAIMEDNFSMIEYSISRIFELLFDVAALENINLRDCLSLKTSLKKENEKESGVAKVEKSSVSKQEEEYLSTKESIKKSGYKEVLFDLIVSEAKEEEGVLKKNYIGLKVKKGRKVYKYESNDIITDFFNASNFIAEEFKNEKYRFNYTASLRTVLYILRKDIFSGYIKDGELVTVAEVKHKLESDGDGKTFFADRSYRPILMTNRIKTLDDLLNHISLSKSKYKK